MRSSSTRQSVPTPRQSQVNTPTQLRTARRNSGVLSPFCPSVSRIAWRTASGCRSARSRAAEQPGADRGAAVGLQLADPGGGLGAGALVGPGGPDVRVHLPRPVVARDHRERDAVAQLRDRRGRRLPGRADLLAAHRPGDVDDDDLQRVRGGAGAGGGHGDDGVDARRSGGEVRVLVDLDGEGRCDGDLRGGHCSSWGGWTGRTATVTLSAPPAVSAAAASAATAACGPPRASAGRATAASSAAPGRYFHSPSLHSSSAPGPTGVNVTTSGSASPSAPSQRVMASGRSGGDGRIQRAGRGGGLGGVVVGEQPRGLGGPRLREPVGPAVAHPADREHAATTRSCDAAHQRAGRRRRSAARHQRGGRRSGGGDRAARASLR